MDRGERMNMIVMLAGGLGFFLYGMKLMSEGLQKVAGSKMRSILEVFTRNRVIGLLVGTFFTALIQSSNAAAVMVVSFVNSGLMKLGQTAGILMGANVGATVTGQLIAFDLTNIAPLFVLAGVVMVMFFRSHLKVSRLGEVLLGFGIFFAGISAISQGLSQAGEVPGLARALGSMANPVLAFLLGFAVTAVLQSSSVTVGIIMLLAREGLMGLPVCLPMMLGCNVGSTMSALIASVGCRKDARRAAVVHLLFNLVSTAASALVFWMGGDRIVRFLLEISGGDAGRAVANANTMIMGVWALVLLPFAGWLVRAARRLIPGDDRGEEEFELVYIGNRHTFSPTTAVLQAVRELERMGEMASSNLIRAMNTLATRDQKEMEQVERTEENIDFLNRKITDYLVRLNQSTLPIDDMMSIGGLFHVVNDIERIGDHAVNVAKAAAILRDRELRFSREAVKDLAGMLDMVIKIMTYSISMFSKNDRQHLQEILKLEEDIDQAEKRLQQRHVERLTQNICMPEAGMLYSDIVSGLERAADHAVNIAFSVLEEEP